MNSQVINEELDRIKEIMGITESSEVMQKEKLYINSVANDLKKLYPNPKEFCSSDNKLSLDKVKEKAKTGIDKIFGPKADEFLNKFNSKLQGLDKSSAIEMINDLRGMIKEPRQALEHIKKFVGVDTDEKEKVSEQFLASLSFAGLAGISLVLFFVLISLVSWAFGNFKSEGPSCPDFGF